MKKSLKVYFQDIHYSRQKPNFVLGSVLSFFEFFYKATIVFKNHIYKKNILKEQEVKANVICVGNLTTGGVGKTPIVIALANAYSKTTKTAVISRGYGAKISNKNPTVIKDYEGLKFNDGTLCSDEPFQCAKQVNENVIVITCKDRLKAACLAIEKYGVETIVLDDGFSNRKIKKDKAIVVIDSKMRFGNSHLLPFGPLREPLSEIKRANEIILVNKGDENINQAIEWVKKFNIPAKLCSMKPKRIYNMQSGAEVINFDRAIAFCSIGQSGQFFDFAKEFYKLEAKIPYSDHYKYKKSDIKELINLADKFGINTFVTTQKDEPKLIELIKDIKSYSFNVLELETFIEDIN